MGRFFIWNLDIGREAVSTYLFQIIFGCKFWKSFDICDVILQIRFFVYSVNLNRHLKQPFVLGDLLPC